MKQTITKRWRNLDPELRLFLLKMKITTLVWLVTLMQVSAAGFAQKISLSEKNTPLNKVFIKISKQSGYDFLVTTSLLKEAKPVTIDVQDTDITEVLKMVFKDQPLSYVIADRIVTISRKREEPVIARIMGSFDNVDISGRVLDNNGQPLVGATVRQKGTTKVTTTDSNGNYTLRDIPEDAVIVISFVGYRSVEIGTKPNKVLLKLELIDNELQEVKISAGYYSVTDRERTGSIARVKSRDIENQPVNNVLSAIQGRMAGVSITSTNGNNAGGFDIQIRGRNSLRTVSNSLVNGNEPLYVIDGIPIGGQLTTNYTTGIEPMRAVNPLNAINPNDIERIEVLKDADATSIYGSMGANGVILVTTKKGASKKLELSLNSSISLSRVANSLEMMGTEQYVRMREQAFINDGISTLPATAYDINGRWDKYRYTDWQKTLIGNTARNSLIQFSVSGGGNRSSFLVSGSRSDQETVYPGSSGYKTNAFNINYNYTSEDKRFSLSSASYLTSQSNNVMNSDFTRQSLMLAPNAPALYDANGNNNWEANTFANPIAATNGKYEAKTLRLNQNINASYMFAGNWKLKVNGGLNYWNLQENTLSPNTMYNPAFPAGASPASSTSAINNSNFISYLLEPQIFWEKSIGKSRLEMLVGASYQETVSKALAVRGTGYSNNTLLHNISAASVINIENLTESIYKYAALFSRLNWNYDKRYILNITGRRDGSSRFGPNKRFSNFAAVGVAWIFSEEAFLKNMSWLTSAKLRGSYGTTGSDRIGDYQYLDTYNVSYSPYNSVSPFIPSRLYNPDFSWEKTRKLETALEISVLQNRLSLVAAWYRNRSSNQLVGVQLPAITGFSSVQANLGATVENSGWEFELAANVIKKSAWRWNSGFNISFPKNKLVSFPGLEGSTYASMYVVGQPTTILKLLNYQGIDPVTGNYQFEDANHDGKISILDDAQSAENIGVRFFGGWHNEVRYKNISFSFLFQFVKQNQTNFFREMSVPGTLVNQPAAFTNVWSIDNPDGLIMPYSSGSNPNTATLTNFLKFSTAAVSDASFVRLKNIQLNYAVPLKGKLVSGAKVFLQGQNLLTWTNYFGLDPEFLMMGYTPPFKSYSLGVQLTF